MQSIGRRLGLLVLCGVSACSTFAGPQEFTGVWKPEVRTELFSLAPMAAQKSPETPAPPLKGDYLDRFNATAQRLREGGAPSVSQDGTFQPKVDCPAPTMPQMMLGPLEIIVTDPVVYVLHGGAARLIFTDGLGHPPVYTDQNAAPRPEEYIPNNLGHSIGHWKGKSLIVDTVGLEENRIDAQAVHSDALHIVERMTLVGADVLEVQITLEDSKALARPWRSTVRYRRGTLTNASGEPPVCLPDARHH